MSSYLWPGQQIDPHGPHTHAKCRVRLSIGFRHHLFFRFFAAARSLKDKKIIDYRRGQVTVLDRPGLACRPLSRYFCK
jgi:hypothetical protein